MNRLIARARRALWTYRQPLTRVPTNAGAPVSDLFLWRKGKDWKTYFELTDMAGLYDAATGPAADEGRMVGIRLFDAAGQPIAECEIMAPRFQRQQVDISALAGQCPDDAGAFCVFHSRTPPDVVRLGSHLAERGYISYRYRDAPLRAYVHGNLDAISLDAGGQLELLGGTSVLPREYRLQYELSASVAYEVALVNPSREMRELHCDLLDVSSGRVVDRLVAMVAPAGSHIFPIMPMKTARRVVIRSRLIMARPLIFRIEDRKLDVLHG